VSAGQWSKNLPRKAIRSQIHTFNSWCKMNTQSDFNNVIIDLKPLQALKLDLFKTAIREPINYDVLIGGFFG